MILKSSKMYLISVIWTKSNLYLLMKIKKYQITSKLKHPKAFVCLRSKAYIYKIGILRQTTLKGITKPFKIIKPFEEFYKGDHGMEQQKTKKNYSIKTKD